MDERRYDFDRLKVLVIALLFPFHAARVFDLWEPNYVKSAATSLPLSLVVFYIGFWFMALMFFLSGSSAALALERRSVWRFVRERVSRLLLPFLFGLVLVVPPQGYMAKLQAGYSGGYLDYLKGYFLDFSDLSGYTGGFTPAHLWFILFLFVLSLAALPIFAAVRRRVAEAASGGRPFRLLDRLASPWAWFAFILLLSLAEGLPAIAGKNPFFYFALLLGGFLYCSDPRFEALAARLRRPTLIVLPFAVALYSVMALVWGLGRGSHYSWGQIALCLTRNTALWLALTALLGYAAKGKGRGSKALAYASRASFPVYILHQSVMMLVARPIVGLGWPIAAQYAAIVASTLILTLGLYELVVRRFKATRFLFGIK
jgi:glucans biosynthesis protein C